jgi:hypothetical protein
MKTLLALLVLCLPALAKAECSRVENETAFIQETEAPDYFTFEHDFIVDGGPSVTWAVTYCLEIDNGLGATIDYAGTKYFAVDASGHLQVQGAVDDSPALVSDPDNFPYLSYTDLLFYTRDFPGTSSDVVRIDMGLNDETIQATLSVSVVPL